MIQTGNGTALAVHKMESAGTAMLKQIDVEGAGLPLIASVLHVEEDGQLWLDVRKKRRNWEIVSNLPITVQFHLGDCHLHIAGIGTIVTEQHLPPHVPIPGNTKSLMHFKPQFGEYIPLPAAGPGRTGLGSMAMDACRQVAALLSGRGNRRLLVFH